MSILFIQGLFFLLVLVILAVPLGGYCKKVMTHEINYLAPIERGIYRFIGPASKVNMNAKAYLTSLSVVSLLSFCVLLGILMTQQWLPFNPQHKANLSFSLAANVAVSFITNTNWQAYGKDALSFFSQIFGLVIQNFLSAAVGLSVLCVFIRGLVQKEQKTLGNLWVDLTKSILYILLPLSCLLSIGLMSQGVVQTFHAATTYQGLDGNTTTLSLGPVASQVAIKILGTNGGGFFQQNAAHPFENPTLFSNFMENIGLLLLPAALIFMFGFWLKDWKQGRTLFFVCFLFLALSFIGVVLSEFWGPEFAHVLGQKNLEGKEMRFGVGWSSLWAVSTTAASNGATNAMMDSFTPLGGMIPMFLMQLGEIIFGGVGSGLYGMLSFLLLTVFIAGLLVGRTPEYLGKKIDPSAMKMVSLIILTPLMLTLFGAMSLVLHPEILTWLTNQGPHAFTEVLYAVTSLANNNGSAFAGFAANQTFVNVLGLILMLTSRFVIIAAILFLAQNLTTKKKMAASAGSLSTTNVSFVVLLIITIIVIGALSFLPAMALGPIAEFFIN